MKLFKKYKEQKTEPHQRSTRVVASRIEQSTRRLAALLGAQSEKLSTRQKKIALFVFGLLTAGVCTGLIIRPFTAEHPKQFSLPPPIETPVHNSLPPGDSLTGQSTYQSLVRIKRIIDSLKYSSVGQVRYDQLMRERPGLVDSLNALLDKY
jgi:hypothetical protein